MAEQWYYRFMDQEMGPVDLSTLRALAADGALGTADEVRCGTEAEWRLAESVEGLFPEAADAGDLLGMLDAEAAAPAVSSPRQARGANCFCRLLGVEVGPMTFEQLAALASAGRLNPQDQVRLDPRAEWMEAGSIVGLFARPDVGPPVADSAPRPGGDLQDLFDSAALEPVSAAETPKATTNDGTRVWYCRILGHEIGPATFEDVHEMIGAGQLSRTDELRHGRRGDWVPADSIVGLFPEEETTVDEDEPVADESGHSVDDDDGYKFDFADFVGDDSTAASKPERAKSRKKGRKSAAETRSRRDADKTRPTAPRETKPEPEDRAAEVVSNRDRPTPAPQATVSPQSSRPTPAPVLPPVAASPGPPANAPARPVPAAMPKPRREIGNPLAGIGSAVGGLFRSVGGLFGSMGGGGLSQTWKPLAAAVVLGGIAYVIYFGSPFSSSRAPEIYDETLAIWEEANRLKETPAEWPGFKDKTIPRVEQLGKELVSEASSRDRLLQLMLYCHRDCLPQILQAGPETSKSKWAEMNDYMEEAKRIAPHR